MRQYHLFLVHTCRSCRRKSPLSCPCSMSFSVCSTVGDKDVVALEVSRYESDESSGTDPT